MNEHRATPFEKIKGRILDRTYRPGQFLKTAQLAESLIVSATPVREALVKLAALGILTEVPGRGYFVSRLSETDIRDLYDLMLLYLKAALAEAQDRSGLFPAMDPADPHTTNEDVGRAVARLFSEVAQISGNRELVKAVQNLNDRLCQVRCCERFIFNDLQEEFEDMAERFDRKDWRGLTQALDAYHQRRVAHAHLITFRLESAACPST